MSIADDIAENLANPKSVENSSEAVEQHDLTAQIEAAKFVAGTNALARNPLGIRTAKLRPPAASDVRDC